MTYYLLVSSKANRPGSIVYFTAGMARKFARKYSGKVLKVTINGDEVSTTWLP